MTIGIGQSVTFVNNDTRSHEIASNPHPTHGSCPAVEAGLGTIGAGTSSELLVVQTNATNYTFRPGNISNGAVTSMTILAPSGAITPEPATLSAVAGGLMVLGRRRRA